MAPTPRAAWARRSTALAGTLSWMLLAFLAGVAVLYVQTAVQATWGGPPLWPVFVGAFGVIVVTVIGFTCGVLFPGRFTAPLVAIGVLVVYQTGLRQALGVTTSSGTYALLSPANGPPVVDTGVYYHVAPDLSIVQVMFMGGIAVALFGVLGLAPALRGLARGASRPRPERRLAASHGRCRPGRMRSGGILDRVRAGRDREAGRGWRVGDPGAALRGQRSNGTCHPGLHVLVRVPGVRPPSVQLLSARPGRGVRAGGRRDRGPARRAAGAREVASVSGGQDVQSGTSVSPPVFEFTAEHVGAMFGQFNGIPDPAGWASGFQQGLLDAFLTGRPPHAGPVPILLGPAQQAVEDALLTAVRSQPLGPSVASAGVSAAAHRFAALSASARHAWLVAHLTALRAGAITLAQIP